MIQYFLFRYQVLLQASNQSYIGSIRYLLISELYFLYSDTETNVSIEFYFETKYFY